MMNENQEVLLSEETRRVLHELRVYQTELEVQNVELRTAQIHLDIARTRYFDLYDTAPVGYCTLSEKGPIMEANLTAATLLGVSRGVLAKHPFSRFILEDDQHIYYMHFKQLSVSGELQACELRMVRQDKTPFWARLETVAAQDADGKRVYRVVFSDITDRKNADEKIHTLSQSLMQAQERERYLTELEMQNVELRTAQAHLDIARTRYFDLYDMAPVGYCTLSEKGLIMEANLTSVTLLGVSRDVLTQQPFSRFILEDDQHICYLHFKQLSVSGELQACELRMVRQDKTPFWARLEMVAAQDADDKRVYRVVFSNITDRKNADEKIHALSQSLMQAQEKERYLISCELHDSIAQNLSVLKINNDLIYSDIPMTFPDLREKLAVSSSLILQTIVAVRNLAYDLRLPGLEEFGLLKALEIYCEETSEKGNLKFDFQSSGMFAIDLDRDVEIHIYRLIQEGMNNIRKHAEADRATILLLGSSPNVILHIRDNGRGFDMKAQELSSAATKRMGIRGMQERVNMIHGSMTIKSQPMKGTQISIKIPL